VLIAGAFVFVVLHVVNVIAWAALIIVCLIVGIRLSFP